jgi:hypothetical protein
MTFSAGAAIAVNCITALRAGFVISSSASHPRPPLDFGRQAGDTPNRLLVQQLALSIWAGRKGTARKRPVWPAAAGWVMKEWLALVDAGLLDRRASWDA